jgi:hypothetical protein
LAVPNVSEVLAFSIFRTEDIIVIYIAMIRSPALHVRRRVKFAFKQKGVMNHVLVPISNNLTTTSTVHRFPTEVNSSPAGQEMSGFSWNPMIHYCVHMNQPYSILKQLNPFYTLITYSFKSNFNNILPLMPMLRKLSLTFKPSNWNNNYLEGKHYGVSLYLVSSILLLILLPIINYSHRHFVLRHLQFVLSLSGVHPLTSFMM